MVKIVHEGFRMKKAIVKECWKANSLGITLTMINGNMAVRTIKMGDCSAARAVKLTSNGIRRDDSDWKGRSTMCLNENFTIGMIRKTKSKIASMSREMGFIVSNVETDGEWFDRA